jgi:copper chaperone CopZ
VRVQEIAIEVSGMTSPDCEKRVSEALMAVSGVGAVRVSRAEGRAVVSGIPDVATPDALSMAVAQAGYVPGDVSFAE